MNIAIFGAGKLGTRIATALLDGDYDITIIDSNEKKLNHIAQAMDVYTYVGDAKNLTTLKSLNMKSYDFAMCCMTSDETNLIVASFAKTLGCEQVAARVREPVFMDHIPFLREHFNINFIINPDLLISSEIHRYLVEKYSLASGVFTMGECAVIELDTNLKPETVGLNISDFKNLFPDMLLIGISRRGKVIIPHGPDVIENGDLLYIIGKKQDILKLERETHRTRKHKEHQKIMIVGGGKTGFYLAKRLSEYGAYVKVVENNKERCHYLANNLKNVMVLYGNAADIDLLVEEGLDEMDAFVTTTGYDEENLLLALTAKNHGVEDVISKISHDSYKELITTLGVDIVLNPLDICTSAILKTIKGDKRVLSSTLLQGQAELMEIFVLDDMGFIGTPLKDLDIPDSIIIAAIVRGSETIIPDGNSIIKEGDKVILVSLLSDIGLVEKLIKPQTKLKSLRRKL